MAVVTPTSTSTANAPTTDATDSSADGNSPPAKARESASARPTVVAPAATNGIPVTAEVGPLTREHELARSESQSIGRAGRGGRLAAGIALLASAFRAVHSTGSGNQFGTAELVGMLENATQAVAARFDGSFLTIGDLSRSSGGRLKHHRSHRSGRDADVGFYFLASDGTPFHASGFVRVFSDGTTADGHRFDVARNWQLLRSMLEFPGAALQYVFVSRPIQRMLLDQAVADGATPELVERARDVMSHYARGHDNHFHVRIHCPATDEACVDREPPRRHARSHHGHARSRTGHVRVAVEAP